MSTAGATFKKHKRGFQYNDSMGMMIKTYTPTKYKSLLSLLPSAERLADSIGSTITSNSRGKGNDATTVTFTPSDSSTPTKVSL